MSINVPWEQPIPASTAQKVLELCGLDPTSDLTGYTIMDFGCGNGRYLEALARYGSNKNLYGLEVMIERVIEVNKKGFKVIPLSPDGDYLPFKSESFDIVFSSNVIEHIPRHLYLHYLVEIYRVLKPGGRFVVGTPNYPIKRLYDMRSALLSKFTRYYLFDDPTHCNKLSIRQLEKDLSKLFGEIHLEPTYIFLEGKIAWLRKPKVRHFLRIFGNKIVGYCCK